MSKKNKDQNNSQVEDAKVDAPNETPESKDENVTVENEATAKQKDAPEVEAEPKAEEPKEG